jgi:hypothetical protein
MNGGTSTLATYTQQQQIQPRHFVKKVRGTTA